MGFASTYLEEREVFPEIIKEAPDINTGIIVVVPSYNEPGICKLLDSLAVCSRPECAVEVIIIINAPPVATQESLDNNLLTLKRIESWKKENIECFFRLFPFMTGQPSIKGWGVGLARKTGMDEAVRRFNSINKTEGVILNLDADCVVEKNYFVSVFNELLKKSDRAACSIYFEHPLSGTDFHEKNYKSITLYELHLRYYYQGLAFSGFPYVFHTVGSAIAVKALPYVKAGGMNRRQAGEDFYFIQKLVPNGGYFNLISTTVYPSPRASFRVPFGTGASIGKLTEEDIGTLLTYNIMAFKELRAFFSGLEKFYNCSPEELSEYHKLFPPALKGFIEEKEWIRKMIEIKGNTSGIDSFIKRFFAWFNMFKIVKYLNYSHNLFFEKTAVDVAASELLRNTGIVFNSEEPKDLLFCYRKLEKNI
jgi:hypothetical protein